LRDNCLPFHNNVFVPSSRVKKSKKKSDPWRWVNMVSWNISKELPLDTAEHPRTVQISSSQRKPEMTEGGGINTVSQENGHYVQLRHCLLCCTAVPAHHWVMLFSATQS
jgi:hypothetical protein